MCVYMLRKYDRKLGRKNDGGEKKLWVVSLGSVGCDKLTSCVMPPVSTAGSLIVFLSVIFNSPNCSEHFRREIRNNETGIEAARIFTDFYVTTSVAVCYKSPICCYTIR